MLSYLHSFHAGNLADVHKHSILAWVLAYLTQKEKPISYLETHSGRALYDLSSNDAQKTAEALGGILRPDVGPWFLSDHPYQRVIAEVRRDYGAHMYPGSPWLASRLLRPTDRLHLAELHPTECAQLRQVMGERATIYCEDGYHLAARLCPPTPRRGLLLVDPSYELKTDYGSIPEFLAQIRRKWNVGILILWYPILRDPRHLGMVRALMRGDPEALCHEVTFGPVRPGHGMLGSGIWVSQPPYGLLAETERLSQCFQALADCYPQASGDRRETS